MAMGNVLIFYPTGLHLVFRYGAADSLLIQLTTGFGRNILPLKGPCTLIQHYLKVSRRQPPFSEGHKTILLQVTLITIRGATNRWYRISRESKTPPVDHPLIFMAPLLNTPWFLWPPYSPPLEIYPRGSSMDFITPLPYRRWCGIYDPPTFQQLPG